MKLDRNILFALAALTACDGGEVGPAPEASSGAALRRFETCEEVHDYLNEVIVETLVDSYYGWGWAIDAAMEDGGVTRDEGPSDYTTTNVQEQGVDEVDLVKTDGNFLYIAEDRALHVVRSWPAEDTAEVGSLDLGGQATGLFLKDDTLLVFTQTWSWQDEGMEDTRGGTGTQVLWVDISDRTTPTVTRTLELDGWMVDGRLIGDDAWLVTSTWLDMPTEAWDLLWSEELHLPEPAWGNRVLNDARKDMARARLTPLVAALTEDMDVQDLLPRWREDGGDFTPMHACGDLYRPGEASRYAVLSLIRADLEDGSVSATGLLSDGWTVYASMDNLYVAQSSWWWWGSDELTSAIHQFHLGDEPEYRATGTVDGWIYDQFALSEHDGFLRVATTDTDWWWGSGLGSQEGGNNLFVLDASEEGGLAQVGAVTGIAPGEQIYSVRMIDDEGYVVTFRQVDPLHVLDLSDPTDPRVVGELELPGYSAYLHPVGEDHLLAVGMAGEEDGTITGLAVNLFDVSDPTSPQLAHQYVIDSDAWSWSEALWDHHAFTYHRDTLTIPTTSWDAWDDQPFAGVIAMTATPEAGIAEVGRVDHMDLVDASECLYDMWWGWEDACAYDYWYATVRRSVYVEDKLYTISDYGVKVNELNDPSVEIASVLFYPQD